jgi:hypothetical protein
MACAFAGSVRAQELKSATQIERFGQATSHKVIVPGTGYEIVIGTGASELEGTSPKQPLLKAIAVWLSANFELPLTDALPRVKVAPAAEITALRYKGSFAEQPSIMDESDRIGRREVVAIYENASKTIYLRDDWTGSTPAELSVLIHEMVHYLQDLQKIKYECPQQREKLAYLAQERWLQLFERDLLRDFEIDPFTLLVITACFF